MTDTNPFTKISDRLDELTKAVDKLSALIIILKGNSGEPGIPSTGGIELAVQITGLKPSTIYKMSSTGRIPFAKPSGGKLIFIAKDLMEWVNSNNSNQQAPPITLFKPRKK